MKLLITSLFLIFAANSAISQITNPNYDPALAKKSLLQKDPTVREKIFDTEYYNWYGSAALPAYLEVSDKIRKTKP